MKKTSEIIAELQKYVDMYGDLPFMVRDNEYGIFNIPVVYADVPDHDGNIEGEFPTIGVAFDDSWEGMVK